MVGPTSDAAQNWQTIVPVGLLGNSLDELRCTGSVDFLALRKNQRTFRIKTLDLDLPDPLSRGGKPVFWVRMRPLIGDATAAVLDTDVEFLRRALW